MSFLLEKNEKELEIGRRREENLVEELNEYQILRDKLDES